MDSTPETVARRLIDEGFNEGNLDVCDELTSPDLVEHQDFGPDHAPGAEGVKAVIASLRRAYSDFRLEIRDLTVRRQVQGHPTVLILEGNLVESQSYDRFSVSLQRWSKVFVGDENQSRTRCTR